MSVFTADAVISPYGRRNQHFRDRDHDGVLDLSKVVLSQDIGPYPAGTTVSAFLTSVYSALVSNYPLHQFTADARIKGLTTGQVIAWAVKKKTTTRTFTADARKA